MSPLVIAGGIGVLLAAGVAVQTARLDAAQTREAQQRDRADQNAAVVKQMQADAERDQKIAADYAATITQLRDKDRALRNRIAAAADTAVCGDSPAIRELLDDARREKP